MSFINVVIDWYEQNKRDLPWRKTTDPYIIWLSEIILQQTRVEQGLPYFYRFAERFPTVSAFAEANEDEILRLWQGLGYYSRGRNMHHTAQLILREHGGYFPTTYSELLKLKGVGEYTAAAISSFSSNEAKAVVDGNVFRLLSRVFKIEEPINSAKARKIFSEVANQLIDPKAAGISNQAIMEFGALQCKPVSPNCEICPLKLQCSAYRENLVHKLPVKLKKLKIRERYFTYIIAFRGGEILLNKRGENDIWQNLYELPLIETKAPVTAEELVKQDNFKKLFGDRITVRSMYGPVKHVLSHQRLFTNFIHIENFEERLQGSTNWFFTDIENIEKLAMPKLIFGFLENFTILKEKF